jgi:hypothetical protein
VPARPDQTAAIREAVRAYTHDGAPLGEAAARFGYTPAALASLARDVRAAGWRCSPSRASREWSGPGRRRETWQLTLDLNPGDNCFVVCGGAPCPIIVQAEFVRERCSGARSKEVSPIFVHSRVLAPSRSSL